MQYEDRLCFSQIQLDVSSLEQEEEVETLNKRVVRREVCNNGSVQIVYNLEQRHVGLRGTRFISEGLSYGFVGEQEGRNARALRE